MKKDDLRIVVLDNVKDFGIKVNTSINKIREKKNLH